MFSFMFATGIESSAPTIHGGRRVDEMEKCGFYRHWEEDFALVEDIGVRHLRFGPPLHSTFIGPGRYDWEFADLTMNALRRRDITPIADLCHFGVPDWIGDFQNPDFPELFADYAGAFAERYPWVQLYTPINEMYVCATWSARLGLWNEQLKSDRTFVTALKHIVRANVLAMHAILRQRPDAIFIQSESSEFVHAEEPGAIDLAEVMNSERFLTLDLNYGHRVDSRMFLFLMDNGMTQAEYEFFFTHNLKHHCILGNDYYSSNEHRVSARGDVVPAGEVFGYGEITRQYFDRYHLPVMHTETNQRDGPDTRDPVHWLWKEWANVLNVRSHGIPILGFTWYSLIDQVDWDSNLCHEAGHVNPVGLFDLHRKIRPVGKVYQQLIASWRDVLPLRSVCLVPPIVSPSEHGEAWIGRRQALLRAIDEPPLDHAAQ